MRRPLSSWVGDHQRIPAVDWFCPVLGASLFLLTTRDVGSRGRDEVVEQGLNHGSVALGCLTHPVSGAFWVEKEIVQLDTLLPSPR